MLAQVALASQGLALHSLMSVQLTPLPLKPALQAHSKPPSVLLQVALASQLFSPFEHSSLSVHVNPSPEKPGLHVHSSKLAQ